MQWVLIVGLAVTTSGAVLVAATALTRTVAENREEATTHFNGNLWVVLMREREQSYVRAGVGLIAVGSAIQVAGVVAGISGPGEAAAVLLAVAVLAIGLAVGRAVAERHVALRFRGYPDLPVDGIEDERYVHHVATVADVRTFWRVYSTRMLGKPLEASDQVVDTRINHGQWQSDCPRCGAAANAWPGNDRVACLEKCGVTFPARFPPDRVEIERILMLRPKPNRNWFPGESIGQLVAENQAHDLGV